MIINTITLIILSIVSTSIIIKFRGLIAKKLGLIDLPNEKRKIHKLPTPLVGGVIIFTNLILINIYLVSIDEMTTLNIFIFIFCFISFIIGLIDDIKKISSTNKLIIIGLIYICIGTFEENFFLKYLYSDSLNKFIYLNVFNAMFSALCILLLINAFNLIDGLNFLAIKIALIWLIYIFIFFENINYSFLIIILSLILMAPFNYKGKFFLGDSGSILIGSFIGIIFITSYNLEMDLETNKISIENIFILFMMPGLDMFRLFVERIYNKTNPFSGDNKHLHHYLIKKFNLNKTLVIYSLLIISPILIEYFDIIDPSINILFGCFVYIIIISYLKKITFYKNLKK